MVLITPPPHATPSSSGQESQPSHPASPGDAGRAHEALVRRFVDELWNAAQIQLADELFTPDCVPHTYSRDTDSTAGRHGPQHIKSIVRSWRQAFPDWHITINDLMVQGDQVMLLTTARGTHRGPLMGIAPTGRRVTFTGMRMFRIADGRIAEYWVLWDWLGLWRQLGAMPARDRIPGPGHPLVRAVERALGLASAVCAASLRGAAQVLQPLDGSSDQSGYRSAGTRVAAEPPLSAI